MWYAGMWGTLDSRLKDPGLRAALGCFILEKPEVITTIDEPSVSDGSTEFALKVLCFLVPTICLTKAALLTLLT